MKEKTNNLKNDIKSRKRVAESNYEDHSSHKIQKINDSSDSNNITDIVSLYCEDEIMSCQGNIKKIDKNVVHQNAILCNQYNKANVSEHVIKNLSLELELFYHDVIDSILYKNFCNMKTFPTKKEYFYIKGFGYYDSNAKLRHFILNKNKIKSLLENQQMQLKQIILEGFDIELFPDIFSCNKIFQNPSNEKNKNILIANNISAIIGKVNSTVMDQITKLSQIFSVKDIKNILSIDSNNFVLTKYLESNYNRIDDIFNSYTLNSSDFIEQIMHIKVPKERFDDLDHIINIWECFAPFLSLNNNDELKKIFTSERISNFIKSRDITNLFNHDEYNVVKDHMQYLNVYNYDNFRSEGLKNLDKILADFIADKYIFDISDDFDNY